MEYLKLKHSILSSIPFFEELWSEICVKKSPGKATDGSNLESLQQAAKSRKGTTVLRLAEDSLRPG